MTILKRGYEVIIPNYGITNKIPSSDSNGIVDEARWPKFNNYSISMKEVITTSIFEAFWTEKHAIFKGAGWFKHNNLELALCMSFKIYNSMVKGLKLKIRELFRTKPRVLQS